MLLLLAAPSAAGGQAVHGRHGPERRDRDRRRRHRLRRLADQHLRARRRRPVLRPPAPPDALRLAGDDPVPGPGLQPLARLRAAARPEHGRRDRAAHERPRRQLLPRALDRRRPHASARRSRSRARGSSRRSRAPAGASRCVDGPTTTRAGLFAPDGSSAGTEGSTLGPFLEGVFTDIAASGEEVLAAGSRRGHDPRLPARRGRRSEQRRRVAADRSRARPPAGRSRACPAASRSCSSRSNSGASLFVQRLEGAAWSPPVGAHPGRQQQRLPARRQRQGPPDRADHLLRLPPRLHDLDRRRGPVVLDVNVGNFDEYPSGARGGHQRDGRRRRGHRRRLRRQGRARHPLHAAHRTGRAPRASAARACRSAAPERRRASCRSSSRPPAATAGSRPRPSCAGPASAAPAAPAAASAAKFRARYDLRRRTAPHPRAGHPAPRQGAHAAPARPPLRRDALMFELNAAERPHARPGRADPGAGRGAAVGAAGGRPVRRDRVRDRLGDRRARRLDRAPALDGHRVRQADGPARRQAADHGGARLARRPLPPRRVGGDGDHRARVRGHRPAHAGRRAGPGHLGQRLGQAQDDRRRSRWCWR